MKNKFDLNTLAPLGSARRKIGAATLATALLVGGYEGFSSVAYRPLKEDVLTIGHGFTLREDGTPVQTGDTITKEQSEVRLRHELDKYQSRIANCIKVPVTPGEETAYTSLAFNIGTGAFCNSTLVRKLNTYDYDGACKEILRWNRFKGQVLPGLENRRKDEYQICIGNKEVKL